MLEPRAGSFALLLAFGWTVAMSLSVYWSWDRVPTLFIPVIVSALPFAAMTRRQAITMRVLSLWLLLLWVVLGLASVGLLYLPAVVAMSIAHQSAKKAPSSETDAS